MDFIISNIGVIILIIVLLILLIGMISDYFLTVTDYSVEIKGLPEEFDGMQIAHLSDLHGNDEDTFFKDLELDMPDMIVCTGDMYDGVQNADQTTEYLSRLQQFAPVYFVSGNHEYYAGKWEEKKETLKEMGIHVLDNRVEEIERDGAVIEICGIEDPDLDKDWSYQKRLDQFKANLAEIPPARHTRIFLNHRADLFDEIPVDFASLVLSGHMHGGHWRFFGHGIFGPRNGDGRDFLPKYTAGVYQRGDMKMVISRGLGDQIKVPRMFNAPELVWITLHTAPEGHTDDSQTEKDAQ